MLAVSESRSENSADNGPNRALALRSTQEWVDSAARSRAHPKRERRFVLACLDMLLKTIRREVSAED
jgi:hypothetical protein